jgi:Na+/H+ antiporter
MHHGTELAVLVTLCFTLGIGAAVAMLCDRLKLPYTILMLAVGLVCGVSLRGIPSDNLGSLLQEGATISPDLIIFIFLPVLVFESAFALDVHSFRRNVGAVMILAGPILVLSAFAAAGLAVVVTSGSWMWSWLPALVFGALISATDPVAVVALLRGLGAPKRLSLLIEGESLLNDGTAIVVFTLLLGMLTGDPVMSVHGALLELVWVAGGGFVVGVTLAAVVSRWLSWTFNQPLVEITLTLMLAYLAMLVAEAVFHVSGVIAVVTAGLWMSGPGRVNISPEVTHFLHRFWQTLSHLANTLIFFLVGLVIATQLRSIDAADLLLIGAMFLGLVLLRFVLFAIARPVMNRVADPLSQRETAVMAWGGLRGAVSLALALVVSQHPRVEPALGRQVLLLTAGVVLLTIVVNGSSMGRLLARLGFGRAAAADRLAQYTTLASVLSRVREHVDEVSHARDLRTVRWDDVHDELAHDSAAIARDIVATRDELNTLPPRARARGYWRQVLSIERAAYWRAFAHGTLGARATKMLDHEIDAQLDRLTAGDDEPPARRVRQLPRWIRLLSGWMRRLGDHAARAQLGLLALRYDLYRGEQLAAERVLDELPNLGEVDEEVRDAVRATYRGFVHGAREQLEDLRANLPELTVVIETRLARRIRLNFERESYRQLVKDGVVDPEAVADAIHSVERRMKQLSRLPDELGLPETADLCRSTPLFEHLNDEAISWLADATIEKVLSPGEVLFEQGDRGDRAYIVARGAVAVLATAEGEQQPTTVDVLGGGDIIGEMALLSGTPRSATIRALTTVTLGEVSRADFEALTAAHPSLGEDVWRGFVARAFDNHLRELPRHASLGRDGRTRWFEQGQMQQLRAGETQTLSSAAAVFVAAGSVVVDGKHVQAPWLLNTSGRRVELRAADEARVLVLPAMLQETESAA